MYVCSQIVTVLGMQLAVQHGAPLDAQLVYASWRLHFKLGETRLLNVMYQ